MYHQSLNSIVGQNQQNASASDIEFYINIYLYFSMAVEDMARYKSTAPET